MNDLYALVELAGVATAADVPVFEKALASAYPEMRYWAAVGLSQLGIKGELKTCRLRYLHYWMIKMLI